MGLRQDGRVTALDIFVVQDGGPYGRSGDFMSMGDMASLMHQPENMRMRGINVYTNTPPRGAQRAPGGVQAVTLMAPLMQKAATQLGIDELDIIKINAPVGQAKFGRPRQGEQSNVSGAFVREAVDKAITQFDWAGMKARSGQQNGSKVTGIGVALSSYAAGTAGLDGLLTIRPDGKVYIQQGIGNLGTASVFDTARAAMEALQTDWDQAEVIWGDSSKHLPWSCIQGGSMTTHAHSRSNWAAGLDAKRKLQEIGGARSGRLARQLRRGGRARLPAREPLAGADVRARGATGDRAGRTVRRPRAARGHQRDDGGVGDGAGRSRADGGGEGQLRDRRAQHVVRDRGSRRSRSTPRPAGSGWSITRWRPTPGRF